jgi:hypothetical protein
MSTPSDLTVATTIRLYRAQKEALKQLPEGISCSVLARILFQLYLDGKISEAVPLILAEAERTKRAIESRQIVDGKVPV